MLQTNKPSLQAPSHRSLQALVFIAGGGPLEDICLRIPNRAKKHHSRNFNAGTQRDCCVLTILNRVRTPFLGFQHREPA
eukprot:4371146-Pyramimonas_sp.AAC.1